MGQEVPWPVYVESQHLTGLQIEQDICKHISILMLSSFAIDEEGQEPDDFGTRQRKDHTTGKP